MPIFISPDGNRTVWDSKPKGYFTPEEWDVLHPIKSRDDSILQTSAEKRQDAYVAEADPLFREAQFYQVEADGFEVAGDFDKAAVARAKAVELKKAYALKKEEIRARIPDDGAERYRMASSGTYHRQDCGYASESAELVTLAEVGERGNGKPCGRCKPPAVEDTVNE